MFYGHDTGRQLDWKPQCLTAKYHNLQTTDLSMKHLKSDHHDNISGDLRDNIRTSGIYTV